MDAAADEEMEEGGAEAEAAFQRDLLVFNHPLLHCSIKSTSYTPEPLNDKT